MAVVRLLRKPKCGVGRIGPVKRGLSGRWWLRTRPASLTWRKPPRLQSITTSRSDCRHQDNADAGPLNNVFISGLCQMRGSGTSIPEPGKRAARSLSVRSNKC